MPRRVQDIIPGNHRSVRDISTPKVSKHEAAPRATSSELKKEKKDQAVIKIHREHTPDEIEEKESPTPPIRRRKHRSGFPWIIGILGVVIIFAGLAFGISGHFASATFNLVPKVQSINVNGTYIIPSITSTSSPFGYEIVTLSGVASTTVSAVQGAFTQTKAQGSIKIYNTFSSQSQRIVAGSRLSGASGLVYRLTSSIIVPGYTTSGSNIVPGSITTTMIADQTGSQYNISGSDLVSDFKFVEYKGTPKYNGLYATLVSTVAGGFSGTRVVIAPNLLASTTLLIQKNLSANLRAQLGSNIPTGYVMYPGVYGSTFASPVVSSLNSTTAQISAGVTVYGIIFKKINLAHFLSAASSTNMFGTSGYITPDIDNLSVSLANPKDFSPITRTNLVAHFSGTFTMVGSIPVDTLKQSFLGISLSQTASILKKYSNIIDISHSSAEITPPWVGTVPNDPKRVTINVKSQ